jgi:capsular exopolysaccharide synthesis family protein
MSRIHEALKKAELERAAAQAAGNGAAPAYPPAAAASAPPNIATANAAPNTVATPLSVAKPAAVAESNGHFSFEELQARRGTHAGWSPDPGSDVFNNAQSGHGAEQFRMLRSRLYQMRGSQPLRTVLVTSSMAGEGKTFVSSNLVRAMVRQAERRVLLIDGDLRCSRLHTVFGAAATPGLSDYLRGKADEPTIIQHGGAGNLCFIPSGSKVSDPSELLSNGRLKTLLERVGPAFDWVIIDSPPCLPVADAGVIANWCDGVLLVVRAEFTPAPVILKSRQELKARNVVGVVLNAVAEGALTYSSYYSSGYGSNGKAAK